MVLNDAPRRLNHRATIAIIDAASTARQTIPAHARFEAAAA
jgi:hypothetical protein